MKKGEGMKKNEAEKPGKVKWVKTRYQGVYYRLSQGDKIHEGKPDKCFFIRYKKEDLRLTVSLGVATYNPGRHDSQEAFIDEADAALYQAKGNGRNRVIVARPDL